MKTVAAAIILKDDNVLLTRRKKGQEQAGYWEFPGGKRQLDESLEDCLKRELSEELGVSAQIGAFFAESIYRYDHGRIQLMAYLTSLQSEAFQLTVHDRIKWVKVKDLLEYRLSAADIPIAQKLIDFIP